MNRLLGLATLGLLLVGNAASVSGQQAGPPRLRGALGITMSKTPFNVRVVQMGDDSPAEQAGVEVNDRILGIDRQPVFMYEDVVHIISAGAPGQEIELYVERNGVRGWIVAVLGTELDAFGRKSPRHQIVVEEDRNPAWPPGYRRSYFDSLPYQF